MTPHPAPTPAPHDTGFNLSTWSIRNPIPTLLLFLLLTGLGLMGFRAMKVQNFPDVDLPTVSVTAALPGAAPAQLENEVARKIENSVASISLVKHIYTRIQEGVVTITVEFKLEKGLSDATDDVRDAVNRVRADLPADLRDPIIQRFDLAGVPFLTYSIASARLDEEALSWFVDNTVARAMLGVQGVGKVGRVGGVTREIRVEVDPARLAALNVTIAEISRQLRRVQQESSGGRTDVGGGEQAIRTIATVQSAGELASMEVPLNDGRRIRLDQVARVEDTIAERRSGAFLDGRPVVGFEITRSRGAGEIAVAEGVRKVLAQLQAEHPHIEVTQAFSFVEPIEEQYQGSMVLLLEGALLAVAVVFLFLRDWRATIVAAVALPLSVFPTFAGMHWLGFTINVVSLLSLALVVGVLVDDAIVEIENIVRHLGLGKTPREAAMEAVEEIGLAVIATTFTLIAVFLPTAFMGGVAGKFFVQFGWTAAIAVFFSLVVARLLTPMMAAYMLRPAKAERPHGWIMRTYLAMARWCIRHRWITAALALAYLVASFALPGYLSKSFIPPDDLSQTQVVLELPPGSTYEQTRERAEAARHVLAQHRHVKLVYTAIGAGATGSDPFAPGGAPDARKATLLLNLTPRTERSENKQQVEAELRTAMQRVAGVRYTVGFGGAGEKLVLAFTSDDGATLVEATRAVERDLRSIGGIGNIVSTASLTRPEVIVRPDLPRAADQGVTAAAIGDTLRIATAGDFEQSVAKLNLSQRQVPIMVRLPKAARGDLDLIGRLAVPGKAGNVRLASVADLAIESGPAQIDRYDRSRNVFIEIELGERALGDVLAEAEKLPAMQSLPPSVKRQELGDVEGMNELFESFLVAMLTGIFCIYAVLVLLFKDFVQPVTILSALVLSFGGAFAALLIANKPLSMPSMIGLVMLMGVATKNSILLVEYAIVARRDLGLSRSEALIDACSKRARPIVMTTMAMGGGMLPIALGWGADPSFRSPMAVAVIGGLITSTFLSLLVVPVAFTFVDSAVRTVKRLFGVKVPAL